MVVVTTGPRMRVNLDGRAGCRLQREIYATFGVHRESAVVIRRQQKSAEFAVFANHFSLAVAGCLRYSTSAVAIIALVIIYLIDSNRK
jgi:hypothetical protein